MDIRKSKYILPNLFTLASVFFGVLAVASCMEGTDQGFRRAAIAILVAMVADSLDGRVARMTRTATRFGIQLDSLADVVSFGMAPAAVAYFFALHSLDGAKGLLGAFIAFLWVACGALRLARFNVMADGDEKPGGWFIGLPIPAAAGILALFVWVATDLGFSDRARLLSLSAGMPSLALLMVSTLPYRSFKRVRMGLLRRIGLIAMVAGVIWVAIETRASAVLLVLGSSYILLGPLEWLVKLPFRLKRRRSERTDKNDVPDNDCPPPL